MLPATPPLIVQLPAADGATPLFAALFLPDPAVHGRGPYPLAVSVYGGPHVMRVRHDFSTANEQRSQALRREGVLVAALDNRGSARRGLAFEAPLRRRFGAAEVEDQVALVRALVEAGLADPARVGAFGWSYGGYMTLMLLAKHPELFSVGVAGAPVSKYPPHPPIPPPPHPPHHHHPTPPPPPRERIPRAVRPDVHPNPDSPRTRPDADADPAQPSGRATTRATPSATWARRRSPAAPRPTSRPPC